MKGEALIFEAFVIAPPPLEAEVPPMTEETAEVSPHAPLIGLNPLFG